MAMQVATGAMSSILQVINAHTDNIANQKSVGYKATDSFLLSQVTSDHRDIAYTAGGVTTKRRIRTQAGVLENTRNPTDIAVSQGRGYFVVNNQTDGKGKTRFTRAGSFVANAEGAYTNPAGYTLMVWPLDREGRLPGATGNTENTTSFALPDSLVPMNLSSVSSIAASTSTVRFRVNLDQRAPVIEGAGQSIQFLSTNLVNNNMTANSIIAPTADLSVGDDLVVTIPGGIFSYTYGGISGSVDLSVSSVFGATSATLPFQTNAGATSGDSFTISTSSVAAKTFKFVPINPQTSEGEFNSLQSLAESINLIKGLAARVANNRLYVGPQNGAEAMNIADVQGTFVTSLQLGSTTAAAGNEHRFTTLAGLKALVESSGLLGAKLENENTTDVKLKIYNKDPLSTVTFGNRRSVVAPPGGSASFNAVDTESSVAITTGAPVLGSTGMTSAFTGATNLDQFTIQVGVNAAETFTYTTGVPNAAAGEFRTPTELVQAINTFSAQAQAVISGNQIIISPRAANAGQALTFANVAAATFTTALGLANSVNYLGAQTAAGVLTAATNTHRLRITTTDGVTTVNTDFTYVAPPAVPDTSAQQFNSLNSLALAIDNSADLVSYVSGGRIFIKSETAGRLISFSNLDATTFTTALGLAPSTSGGGLLTEFGLTTVPTGPAYDPQGSTAGNMSSGTVPSSYSYPLEIYDSFGSRHDFKIHYAKIATNRWSVELAAVDTKDVLVSGGREDGLISYGTLVFNGEANLETISGPIINPVTISWENRAANNVVTLDFGKTANENQIEKAGDDNNSAKMTQFAGSYDSIVNQNGVSPADRESITIDNDGKVIVNFRNGLSRAVFKIPLATFPNPGGLNGLDGNVFSSNVEAGTLNLREAATGDAGTIAAGRLEQSNVDLAEELSNIVQAQRLYEANAQVAGIHSDILKLLGRIFD